MATHTFHRPARRFPQAVPAEPLKIVNPPTMPPPKGGVTKMLMSCLPMLGMLAMMSMMFFFPSPLIVKIAMGAGCVLMGVAGFATNAIQDKEAKAKRKSDAAKYNAYLDAQNEKLAQAATVQRAGLERVHPHFSELIGLAAARTHLWERRKNHPDFLHARVGTGAIPLAVPAVMDENNNPLTDFEPELHKAATSLVEQYTALPQAPFALELESTSSLAVIGDEAPTHAVVRSLICQLATAHAPADLTIAAYFPTANTAEWAWMKWLPHTQDPSVRSNGSGPRCLLVNSPQGLATILSEIVQQRQAIAAREKSDDGPKITVPHLVLLIDGFAPRSEIAGIVDLNTLLSKGKELETTTIALVRDRQDEPTHVSSRLEIDPQGNFRFQSTASNAKPPITGEADQIDCDTAEAVARSLTPLRLREDRDGSATSSSGNLFSLLGVAGPDAVDPARTWKPRSLDKVMQVPLGIRADGEPLILDLKESAVGGMGPHGLVVGATGSGKSELLRTFVTGLAINHSPDILSFVFVDFKGGAAFADLAELPHVAGMITNLQGDLSRVDRMYSALVGEQARRQSLLRDAGNVDGIKEYQALYARHPEMEPMPYLVIVVDEFGELLVARPDFLDLFNAIGRVGRSLGMHLLLASQRLEEGKIRGLEGHLRYRICLRTFSTADSKAVLGTADAYHLPSNPGAGYFKVDTFYHRFQTAHVSAPYSGTKAVTRTKAAAAVAEFTGILEPQSGGASVRATVESDGPTEMEVAIRRLRERSRGLMRPVHQVWLPPLGSSVSLGDTINLANALSPIDIGQPMPFGVLRSIVGILDIPEQQTQVPLLLDFSGSNGNLVLAGAPQTGKSTFLRSLITSFAITHSPRDAQFYCIDLGGGSLHALEGLPHVGAVCGKLEKDRIRRLVREMFATVEERELSFRRNNVDSIATFRRRRMAGELPGEMGTDVFLVIDNWGALRADFEDIDFELAPLVANGLGYGVHVLLTTNRWADIRPQLKDNIGFRLEFRLNDPTESEMPRNAAKSLPTGVAGRGINQQALQFQIATPSLEPGTSATSAQEVLERAVGSISQKWHGAEPATPIRLLPSIVRANELPDPKTTGRPGVPLGIDEFRLQPLNIDLFSGDPHFLIIGDSESGKSNLIRVWMEQLMRRYTPEEVQFVLVDYRRALLDAGSNEYLHRYAATPNLASEALAELHSDLVARLPGADVTREQLVSRSWWSGPEFVIFVDDYDLVVSPSGNPIATLTDLLPQGRDVGMHLVLSRRVGGIARSAFEAVFQRIRELGTPGLVMSGDPQEGPILGTQKASLLPAGRGYLVRRGERTLLLQTALSEHSH
jgi:ESX secretion system protein EccC